jgi:hypothetical protein
MKGGDELVGTGTMIINSRCTMWFHQILFICCSLLQSGYSLESIATATLEADSISRDRLNSASNQNWDKVSEVSERFGRLFSKALRRKSVAQQSTVAAISA